MPSHGPEVSQSTLSALIEKGEVGRTDDLPELGQYFTPKGIANKMASLFDPPAEEPIQVLDPGSGQGVLSVSAVKRLVEEGASKIRVDAYEIDSELAEETARALETVDRDHESLDLDAQVHEGDFIIERWNEGLRRSDEKLYDFIITNPPYFKINKDSRHGQVANEVVWGQPNMYGIFLVLCARLLREGGQLVAIAPRSWLSGSYFKKMRADVLSRISLEEIHAFRSRTQAFSDVIQETTIFTGTHGAEQESVEITVTEGLGDLKEGERYEVPWSHLCPSSAEEGVLLPETVDQIEAVEAMGEFSDRLADLGLEVNTGPVVPFRSEEYLLPTDDNSSAVPLLWMKDVQKGFLAWDGERDTEDEPFVEDTPSSEHLLLEGEEMVLVRRFSAKEDPDRTIACRVPEGELGEKVAIENHLNVIRGFGDRRRLAESLTEFLNSDMVDEWMRAKSGTTQVNATDLEDLPVPAEEELVNRWRPTGEEKN